MYNLQTNISLKEYSNFKIGGNAKYFLNVTSVDDLTKGLEAWHQISKDFKEDEKKIFILGGATNVLFPDEGLNGLVIKDSIDFIDLKENVLTVGGGTLMSKLLDYCIENGLSGLEWAGGLPGTVGGALRGNAGAYGGETKDNILEVESVNMDTLKVKKRGKRECEFNYRTSIFKTKAINEIITFIKFEVTTKEKEEVKNLIEDKINKRILRHPLEYPNVGSIFKNVPIDKFSKEVLSELSQYIKDDPFPVISTAKLSFLSGVSGKTVGDAQLSTKHTNFIVNLGNAKAADVKKLIQIIQKAVKERFGVDLEVEVMFID